MKIAIIILATLNLLHLASIWLKPASAIAPHLKYMDYAVTTLVEIVLLVIISRSFKKRTKQ